MTVCWSGGVISTQYLTHLREGIKYWMMVPVPKSVEKIGARGKVYMLKLSLYDYFKGLDSQEVNLS